MSFSCPARSVPVVVDGFTELLYEFVFYFLELFEDFRFEWFDVEVVLVLLVRLSEVVFPDIIVAEEAFCGFIAVVGDE